MGEDCAKEVCVNDKVEEFTANKYTRGQILTATGKLA